MLLMYSISFQVSNTLFLIYITGKKSTVTSCGLLPPLPRCLFFYNDSALVILRPILHGRINGETLKSYTLHWPPQRWQEYEPLLSYCRDNGIRLVACGTPLQVCLSIRPN